MSSGRSTPVTDDGSTSEWTGIGQFPSVRRGIETIDRRSPPRTHFSTRTEDIVKTAPDTENALIQCRFVVTPRQTRIRFVRFPFHPSSRPTATVPTPFWLGYRRRLCFHSLHRRPRLLSCQPSPQDPYDPDDVSFDGPLLRLTAALARFSDRCFRSRYLWCYLNWRPESFRGCTRVVDKHTHTRRRFK